MPSAVSWSPNALRSRWSPNALRSRLEPVSKMAGAAHWYRGRGSSIVEYGPSGRELSNSVSPNAQRMPTHSSTRMSGGTRSQVLTGVEDVQTAVTTLTYEPEGGAFEMKYTPQYCGTYEGKVACPYRPMGVCVDMCGPWTELAARAMGAA